MDIDGIPRPSQAVFKQLENLLGDNIKQHDQEERSSNARLSKKQTDEPSQEETLMMDPGAHAQSIEISSEYMDSTSKQLFVEAGRFFFFYSSKVEIFRDDTIQEIYFIKMPYSIYLEDADKDKFNIEVDRKTTLNKVKSLLGAVGYLGSLMKFGYFLNASTILFSLLFKHEAAYTLISFLTACFVNVLIIISFATSDTKNKSLNMTSASLAGIVEQEESSYLGLTLSVHYHPVRWRVHHIYRCSVLDLPRDEGDLHDLHC
jgi:hypothetical protein